LIASMPDPYTVLKYEHHEEFQAFFEHYNADFIKKMILPNAVCGESLNSRMLQYLQEHYSDPNFSLQQMADDFKLTPITLSKQFLEFNGQTPSDYMTNFRIEAAKRLLTTTDLSVNQIAAEVGYYNVNSFIRRFGQITGVTPGKFKSQITKKQ
ncbi:MAG: AraC family transcriptional regulator, partial [Firmicutes bacterium]|nr:AraC family transcriptional regulator [Bacillota bacterium]